MRKNIKNISQRANSISAKSKPFGSRANSINISKELKLNYQYELPVMWSPPNSQHQEKRFFSAIEHDHVADP